MGIHRPETDDLNAQPLSGEHPVAQPESGAFPLRVEGPLDSLEDAWFTEEKPPSARPSRRPAPAAVEPGPPLGDTFVDRWFR
jgi:hypothetical protein